ncbi:hypothetical protein ACFL4W_02365 [Planctomycetota bacterium]
MKKTAILALSCLIIFSSCTYVNPRVRLDDVEMKIVLKMKLVRANAERDDIGMERGLEAYFDTELSDNPLEDFAGKIILAPFVLPIYILISEVAHMEPTDVYLKLHGFHPDYFQRLKWGNSIVWFPRELEGETATVSIIIDGKYEGGLLMALPVIDQKQSTLKQRMKVHAAPEGPIVVLKEDPPAEAGAAPSLDRIRYYIYPAHLRKAFGAELTRQIHAELERLGYDIEWLDSGRLWKNKGAEVPGHIRLIEIECISDSGALTSFSYQVSNPSQSCREHLKVVPASEGDGKIQMPEDKLISLIVKRIRKSIERVNRLEGPSGVSTSVLESSLDDGE